MYNSTVNFTTSGASTSSTSSYEVTDLEICMFCINVLFGFPTHFYVIWLIVTGTGNGITSEFFFLNLSVCEILICLDCLLSALSKYVLGLLLLALFLQGLVFAGRPLFQCLMCLERYLAVVHPVIFLKYKPLRYRVMCCAAVWLFCLGSCVCCMVILLSFSITGHAVFFSVFFLVFFFVQLFCLLAVLRGLKRSGPGEREEENHMKRRAFYLILITTVSMFITYLPMFALGMFIIATKKYIAEFWVAAFLLYVLGGFLQPVLYLYRCGKLFCMTSS